MSAGTQTVTDVAAVGHVAWFVAGPVLLAALLIGLRSLGRDLFRADVDPDDVIDWDMLAQTPRRVDDARRAGAR